MAISDRVIGVFSPTWALKRMQARQAMGIVRGYESASTGKRFLNKRVAPESKSKLWADEAQTLTVRARDMVRNNGWAKSSAESFVDTLVGQGITPRFVVEGGGEADVIYEKAFRIWATRMFCDYEGTKSFYQMQRLIAKTWMVDGEIFIREIVSPNSYPRDPALPLPPVKYQLISQELIDVKKKGDTIINGIQYQDGRPVGYWIFPQNPLEVSGLESVLIPAEEIIHLKTENEVGQTRGVSMFDASLKPLKDGDDYEDASVIQRKISSCLTGFLQGVEYNEEGESTYEIPDSLEPGSLVSLPDGVDVKFSTPPVVSDYKDVSRNQVYKSVAGLGLSYEDVTKDVSQVNYSSLRGSRNSQERHISSIRDAIFIPVVLNRIADRILELWALDASYEIVWNPPSALMLDPEKEGKAYKDGLRSGIYSLPDVLEKLGKVPAIHLQTIADTNEKLDSLSIALDSDPRKTTQSGQFQVVPETDT